MTTFNSLGIGRTIGAGVNELYPSDFQISFNSTNGVIILNLPTISSVLQERSISGYLQIAQFLLADISGTAGVNKITLVASNGESVNGLSSIDLNINNISAVLTPTSHNTWVLVASITSGGSGGSTYINPNPMPVTIGGYSAGTTFPTPQTMQQMWDGLLYPYQSPAFTSLSNGLFASYEVGENLPSGLINIAYTVSNSSNIKVQPPNVGVPSTNIVGATFPINPFFLLGGGTFGIIIAPSTTSSVPATFSVSCQGTNTNNVTFSTSNSLSFFYRSYWGFNANPSLTGADILLLASSQLKTGFAGTYTMPSNSTPRYLYFAYNDSFGYPTTIFDITNGFNATSDFIDLGTIVANNQFGVSQTWRIIRSVNATSGAGGFQYLFS